jgi:hypothetical protein
LAFKELFLAACRYAFSIEVYFREIG